MFRLLVTGARIWDDNWTLSKFLNSVHESHPDLVIVHGACPSGADKMAKNWAILNGVEHEPHPAKWQQYGKAAGHMRNLEMVTTNPDYAVAFIKGEAKGTNNCLGHIIKAGIPHAIFRDEQR